jgi:hypothetical protein
MVVKGSRPIAEELTHHRRAPCRSRQWSEEGDKHLSYVRFARASIGVARREVEVFGYLIKSVCAAIKTFLLVQS